MFVLYFRILKSEKRIPLLPAALQGISRFAHLVNVDFFKDLLGVLREHISRTADVEDDEMNDTDFGPDVQDMHHRLQCIVTAFELLSGQGKAYLKNTCPMSMSESKCHRGSIKYRSNGFR